MTIVVYKGSIKDAIFLYSYEGFGFIPRKNELITFENETYIVNTIQYDLNENTVRIFVDIYNWE